MIPVKYIVPPAIEPVQADDTVGVIIPPPELKTVIDKTAQYVAKNGPAFEKKILEANASEKFAFLQNDHPFHPYYKQCIEEYYRQAEDEMRDEDEDEEASNEDSMDVVIEQFVEPVTTQVISKKADVLFKPGREKPTKDPLVYSFELPIPPTMTPVEFDIIKLMAQFTAKNGKQFLYTISARENRNPQFDFLKLQHRHFPFFSKLTEIYARILAVPKPSVAEDYEDLNWLRFLSNKSNKVALLDKLYAKAEWDVTESERRRKQEVAEREEREAFNMIDWHDFVVVDKIDFADEYVQTAQMEDVEYEKYYDHQQQEAQQEEAEPGAGTPQPVRPEQSQPQQGLEDIESKLVKNVPKKSKKTAQGPQASLQYFKDTTTNQLIPVDKVQDHMRIRTIDPRWKDQKDREMAKFQSTNIATDAEITDQLTDFARHRGDIFGKDDYRIGANTTGQTDTPNIDPSAIWDGHAGSADVTSHASNLTRRSTVQPEQVHASPSVGPSPDVSLLQQQAAMMAAQAAMSMMNPLIVNHPRPPIEDEESSKRFKQDQPPPPPGPPEETNVSVGLVPEREWIQQFTNGSMVLRVETDDGQISANITVPVTDTIDDLKNLIQQQMNIPKQKQKLRTQKLDLIKDDWRTVGYYNLGSGDNDAIQVVVKTRGRKKK
jgi:splicing factor 3A subunit 1